MIPTSASPSAVRLWRIDSSSSAPTTRSGSSAASPRRLASRYASLGVVDRKRTIQSYAGKLSANVSGNHRFDVSLFGDPSKGESGLQRYSELRRIAYADAPGTTSIDGGSSELEYGGHNQTLRYDGIVGASWLVEANLASSSNKFNEIATVDDWFYQDLRFTPNGRSGGLGSYERDKGSNFQYGVKSTHILSGAGDHQVRYGVGLENIEFTRDFDYSGPNLLLSTGGSTVTGGPIQIRLGTDAARTVPPFDSRQARSNRRDQPGGLQLLPARHLAGGQADDTAWYSV